MDFSTPETVWHQALNPSVNRVFNARTQTHKTPRLLFIGIQAHVFQNLAGTCKIHGWQQQWQQKIHGKNSAHKLNKIDVAIVHLTQDMCNSAGSRLIRNLKNTSPTLKVLIIVQDTAWMLSALRAGADDCLSMGQTHLLFQTCKKLLSEHNQEQEHRELAQHLAYFKTHDRQASHLLKGLLPEAKQRLGAFDIECHCTALNLIPLFYLLDEHLLMFTVHAPNLEQSTAVGILTVHMLLNYLYHQYKIQENRILLQPGKILSFLNWHLCESGLKQLFHMSASLFHPTAKQLTLANGGFTHPQWRKHVHDLPLGILKNAVYTQRKLPFEQTWKMNMPHPESQQTSVTIQHNAT